MQVDENQESRKATRHVMEQTRKPSCLNESFVALFPALCNPTINLALSNRLISDGEQTDYEDKLTNMRHDAVSF